MDVANCADYFGRESLIIIILLELAFANKALRNLCESSAKANRELGVGTADKLRRRVADLRAAISVSDLLLGAPKEVDCDGRAQIAVDLNERFQITFCANHNTVPKLESGKIDWSKVSRVKILTVEEKNG
jgi:hypothetical protein